MPKVLVSDKLSEDVVAIFKSQGISVDYKSGMSPEELGREIHHYDGLAVRSASKITKELILAASNLKVIGRAGIGCLLYTSPSPRDATLSRMPSSA